MLNRVLDVLLQMPSLATQVTNFQLDYFLKSLLLLARLCAAGSTIDCATLATAPIPRVRSTAFACSTGLYQRCHQRQERINQLTIKPIAVSLTLNSSRAEAAQICLRPLAEGFNYS